MRDDLAHTFSPPGPLDCGFAGLTGGLHANMCEALVSDFWPFPHHTVLSVSWHSLVFMLWYCAVCTAVLSLDVVYGFPDVRSPVHTVLYGTFCSVRGFRVRISTVSSILFSLLGWYHEPLPFVPASIHGLFAWLCGLGIYLVLQTLVWLSPSFSSCGAHCCLDPV